jgi:hypothetical protein
MLQDLGKASAQEISGVVDRCVKELGGLHILVNNGTSSHSPFEQCLLMVIVIAGVGGSSNSTVEEWQV